jgi:hypothetical protein
MGEGVQGMGQIGGNIASFGEKMASFGTRVRTKGRCGRWQTLRVVASEGLPPTDSLPTSFERMSDGDQDQADRNDRP